jgi:hypothetical protein
MSFARHSDFRIQRLTIGNERAPLLVVDNVVADPEALVELASSKVFGDVASYFPGVRSKVPLTLQQFFLDELRGEFAEVFGLRRGGLRVTSCHFSLVTTPPSDLTYLQRIPHIDSLANSELAFILYLFKANLGGTAFYRHRKTGFESVDQGRRAEYWRQIEQEQAAVEQASRGYISGDTEFYERIGRQEGVFNRMLIYRRTSLHSADLAPNFVASADPRRGRLSVNGFIA